MRRAPKASTVTIISVVLAFGLAGRVLAQAPAETRAQAPAEARAQAPAETRAQAPIESGAQAPAEARMQEPGAADGPRLAPSEAIPPAELEAFLDATIRLAMDQYHIAGAAVSVVQDGRLVLEKGYGFASFDPPRRVDPATTLFRIGSISKTFTWIEVMKAVEAGKMSLDAPVNNYLPADLRVPDEGFGQPIRVRDLLTHSPGFEDRVLGVLFVEDPKRLLSMHDALERFRPKRVRGHPARHRPRALLASGRLA